MKTENEMEKEIKGRIEHIAPSRALFEQTMESVTKMQMNRNTSMKAPVLSPLQFFRSSFIRKTLAFAIPIVAIVLMITVAKNDPVPVITENNNQTTEETIDTIIASLMEEVSAEALIVASESEEEIEINNTLQTYNELKNYSYENTI